MAVKFINLTFLFFRFQYKTTSQSDTCVTGLINLFNRTGEAAGAEMYRLMGTCLGFMLKKRFDVNGMNVTEGNFRQLISLDHFNQVFGSFPDLQRFLCQGFKQTLGQDNIATMRLVGTVGSVSIGIGCDQTVGSRNRVRLYLHLY